MQRPAPHSQGFTLIELSIVLVIIGLIVGGVLVGQDLIRAAGVRATITQIEKYNTATNAFRDKYGGLPGDLNTANAVQFGISNARGTAPGEGDGNGIIEGNTGGGAYACGYCVAYGEPLGFWVDLSSTQMIDGSFSAANDADGMGTPDVSGSTISLYVPAAKIGNGNYVYVWSGGPNISFGGTGGDGQNYFAISAIQQFSYWEGISNPGLTVKQAYDMDKKIDDGYPQSGRVTALYIDANTNLFGSVWAGSGGKSGAPYTTATPGSSSTCFDNGNVAGVAQQYSVETNNGDNVNCALSFQFQ